MCYELNKTPITYTRNCTPYYPFLNITPLMSSVQFNFPAIILRYFDCHIAWRKEFSYMILEPTPIVSQQYKHGNSFYCILKGSVCYIFKHGRSENLIQREEFAMSPQLTKGGFQKVKYACYYMMFFMLLRVHIHTAQAEKFAWSRWESNPRPLGY